MADLCEGGNEPSGSLKARRFNLELSFLRNDGKTAELHLPVGLNITAALTSPTSRPSTEGSAENFPPVSTGVAGEIREELTPFMYRRQTGLNVERRRE
ncbi:hypothetical protein ANN_25750 [Periplaneta americana]|uniref:Uncharacterized protein n=1 Tax=Periplaneta americana TaxID=6978 RepID=A0ABQ8S428_PERAM|nr:hypothetical protein ANN_25750 [Periplaneta americana]